MSAKKVIKKIFLVLLIIILVIILSVGGFFLFSSLDKKKSISMIPQDYSLYVHTDSAWDAVEPLLDLQAMDMFFSSPDLVDIRGIFMQLRATEWRNSKLLSFLASKSIDAAIYNTPENKNNFLVLVDLKALSALSRLAPLYYNTFNPEIKGLSYENDLFVFDNNSSKYFIKTYKNLVIASDNIELLNYSLEANHGNYSEKDLQIINQKSEEPIKIIANATKLINSFNSDNKIVKELLKVIPKDGLSSISFKITDNDIKLNAHVPFELTEENENLLTPILSKRSTTPAILSRLRENVQYYTIINAGTLEQLKNSFMPLFVENAESTWQKFNNLSKASFSVSLEDLLFSWSGNEVIVFGIENRNNPVFGIQIKDEQQRKKVFEKFLNSILIKDDSSLILDGIRIPRIELPSFLQELLNLFDISLPNPYYLIQNGYIYFTESPENLCEIYKAKNKIGKISADTNWNLISTNLSPDSTMSLYYNLERSIPFFLKSNANISKVLSLYSIGRTDFSINNSEFLIQLSAVSKRKDNTGNVAGFPLQLNGKTDGELVIESNDSNAQSNALYWIENNTKLVSMELPSTKITELDINDYAYICPCKAEKIEKDKVIWCVTTHGAVYLMNRKFEVAEGYPLLLNDNINVRPTVVNNGIYICTENGKIIFIGYDGTFREIEINLMGSIKSSLAVYESPNNRNIIAYYDKSFFGKVHVIQDWEDGKSFTFDVSGISYGSPSFLKTENDELPDVGFLTQNGLMYIWKLSTEETIQKVLSGIYKSNVVSVNNHFFAVSTQGLITKISLTEELDLSVQIPNVTCNEAFITIIDSNIYICPDGNVIYAFDSNLELLYPFPVKGWGRPAFADVNGDKKNDCFTLSVDNKIYAVSMR